MKYNVSYFITGNICMEAESEDDAALKFTQGLPERYRSAGDILRGAGWSYNKDVDSTPEAELIRCLRMHNVQICQVESDS